MVLDVGSVAHHERVSLVDVLLPRVRPERPDPARELRVMFDGAYRTARLLRDDREAAGKRDDDGDLEAQAKRQPRADAPPP